MLKQPVGTPEYMSPEVVETMNGFGETWSVHCIVSVVRLATGGMVMTGWQERVRAARTLHPTDAMLMAC